MAQKKNKESNRLWGSGEDELIVKKTTKSQTRLL